MFPEVEANAIKYSPADDWARPFFNQNADYKALSKEEREQRDYERLTKRRKLSESEGSSKNSNNPDK